MIPAVLSDPAAYWLLTTWLVSLAGVLVMWGVQEVVSAERNRLRPAVEAT